MQITNADKKIAKKYLKKTKNNLEQAINEYFSDLGTGSIATSASGGSLNKSLGSLDKKSSMNSLHKKSKQSLFDLYAQDSMIDVDGTQKLLQDLEIDPNDKVFIAISYYFNSPSMCEFNEQGFNKGCSRFGITTIDSFKAALGIRF